MITSQELVRKDRSIHEMINAYGVTLVKFHFDRDDYANDFYDIAKGEVSHVELSYFTVAVIITEQDLTRARLKGWNSLIPYLLGCANELDCDMILHI